MRSVEIAVVGGGVAAAAAVLALRERDRTIAVVAPSPPSGFLIGESLSRAAERELECLKVLEAHHKEPYVEAQSRFSAWGSSALVEESAWPAAQHHGWILDRARFNDFLWEHASATPHSKFVAHVEKVTDDGEEWSLALRNGEHVRAKIVLDCSGRAAVVARRLGERMQLDKLVAAYSVFPHLDEAIEPTVAAMVESVPLGWCYSVVTPDGSMVVAFFTDSDQLPSSMATSADVWRETLAGCVLTQKRIDTAGFRVDGTPQIVDASTRISSIVATPRWLAAGDAAVCFDPLSSHGITTALWSGRTAALAADDVLAGETHQLATYDTTLRAGIDQYLLDRLNMYAAEQRFASLPFWRRRVTQRESTA